MKKRITAALAAIMALMVSTTVMAQNDMGAMPFLKMAADARIMGMGGYATASTDNPLAVYSNAATAVLGEKRGGASLSASYLGGESENSLYGAGGFAKIGKKSAIVAGVRYMCGMEIALTGDDGQAAGDAKPKDMSFEAGYVHALGKNFSVALTGRYFRSDLDIEDGTMSGFSFDVAAAWRKKMAHREGGEWSVGLRLADLGGKVEGSALPTRLTLGGAMVLPFNKNHKLGVNLDVNHIFEGAVTAVALGAEYTFLGHGTIRAGYHLGSDKKGVGSYATVGCGVKAWCIRLDAAYIFADRFSPLNKTLHLSLGFVL